MLFKQRPSVSVLLSIGGTFFLFVLGLHFWLAPPATAEKVVHARRPTQGLIKDVFNETLGFEKIFVVNLPSRTDHHDSMVLAAAVSNIKVEWINGIKGEAVLKKVLPPGDAAKTVSKANIGSWRAHMNAVSAIVEQNLTSALILEDDADWDIRIRPQLRDFAKAAHALIQPLSGHNPSVFADPTYLNPQNALIKPPHIDYKKLPSTTNPVISPYGDGWDVLWLGHCGQRFPDAILRPESKAQPKGRVVRLNDKTVPEKEYLHLLDGASDDASVTYPAHTRVVHHATDSICSLGYALTQAGARRILYEMAIKSFNTPFDLMLRDFCQGSSGREQHVCLTVQPQLFNHHRPVGRTSSESDISEHGDEIRTTAETQMIRWSTKVNFEKLLKGETDYHDPYPDKAIGETGSSPVG